MPMLREERGPGTSRTYMPSLNHVTHKLVIPEGLNMMCTAGENKFSEQLSTSCSYCANATESSCFSD